MWWRCGLLGIRLWIGNHTVENWGSHPAICLGSKLFTWRGEAIQWQGESDAPTFLGGLGWFVLFLFVPRRKATLSIALRERFVVFGLSTWSHFHVQLQYRGIIAQTIHHWSAAVVRHFWGAQCHHLIWLEEKVQCSFGDQFNCLWWSIQLFLLVVVIGTSCYCRVDFMSLYNNAWIDSNRGRDEHRHEPMPPAKMTIVVIFQAVYLKFKKRSTECTVS